MKHTSLFIFLLSLAALSSAPCAETYYVDQAHGNDAGAGSKTAPFQTIAQAMKLVDGKGGEIHLAPGSGPYRENVLIRLG